jgi:hypothetical protein
MPAIIERGTHLTAIIDELPITAIIEEFAY